MIGRCVPCLIDQFHLAQFLDSDTAPICRRTRRLQSTAAIARVLIAKHSHLAFVIAAQAMRAQTPFMTAVHRANRTFAFHRHPDQSINVLNRLDLRSNNAHTFTIAACYQYQQLHFLFLTQ